MKPVPTSPRSPKLASLLALAALSILLTGCARRASEPATVMAAPAADAASEGLIYEPRTEPRTVPRASTGAVRRGVVTAGDIDDTRNFGAFQRYLARKGQELRLAQSNFTSPVMVQLTGPDGAPAPGVRVTLRRPGASEPFYDGYSGVDGFLTVFPALYGAGRLGSVELRAYPQTNGAVSVHRIATSGNRTRVSLPFDGGWEPGFLDLVLVVDTTGSMGDEIAWLTRELSGIVRVAKRGAPGLDIRYGLVVYRDQGDEYVVRNYGFTSSEREMQGWLRAQEARGGGDYPEAAAAALRAGAGLNWRRGRGERLMFHVADAPPHARDARAYLEAARMAMANGVQVFGLGASGVAAESEYLMRQAALQTEGRYLFLTDDSGVGNSHAEPTISCYRVTKLSELMVRVLRSELSGLRLEASERDTLREVGSYRAGYCQN